MRCRAAQGFTLIEIMVAIALLAMVGALAYQGLSGVLNARTHLSADNEKWRDLAQVFARLEADVQAAVNRRVRDSFDSQNGRAALLGAPDTLEEAGAALVLTRMGSPAQQGALADSQRIGYRLRDNKFELLLWPALDQPPRATPSAHVLLADVATAEFRFLDAGDRWQTKWPQLSTQPGANDALPRALELKLTLLSGESFSRLMVLP